MRTDQVCQLLPGVIREARSRQPAASHTACERSFDPAGCAVGHVPDEVPFRAAEDGCGCPFCTVLIDTDSCQKMRAGPN